MKNIHLVLAEESYLSLNCSYRDSAIGTEVGKPYWIYSKEWKHHLSITDASVRPHNIYITSDEKFVRDEYITDGIEVIKATPKLVNAQGLVNRRNWRKVILTTDQELIKDGVQAIDDEFLEWFVKNPSCEWVEVISNSDYEMLYKVGASRYKIIIPKEEPKQDFPMQKLIDIMENDEELRPKQETLEEAAGSCAIKENRSSLYELGMKYFIEGAKWQQEKMYSEEEVVKLLIKFNQEIQEVENVREWFEQFKKK